MAEKLCKIDKNKVLTTVAREIVFNCVLKGLNLKEAANEAKLDHNYVQKWVSQSQFYPLLEEERAKINQTAAERLGITQEYLLRRYQELSDSDVTAYLDKDGCISDLKSLPGHIRRAISSIETIPIFGRKSQQIGVKYKIKLWDKTKALHDIGKAIKLFDPDINVDQSINFNITKYELPERKAIDSKELDNAV